MGSNDGRERAPIAASGRAPQNVYSLQQTLILDETMPSALDAQPSVPLSIFGTDLSGLQAIVRYLHEHGALSFSQIATLLNRSPKTIWTTYQHARAPSFPFVEDGLRVPVARFAPRDLSVLEVLVTHLAALGFTNAETARLLALDARTTWTVRKRAERKGVRV